MVSQGAEEAANPRRDVPLAVVSATAFCGCLYAAAATVIVGLVPYASISSAAPFADAFASIPGYGWVAYVVSVGAVAGTFNTVLVTLFSLQRITVVLGRAQLLPRALAAIHPRTRTPVAAGAATALLCALLALVVPLATLANAVSMGTLTAFSVVCLGVAWRARYPAPGCGTPLWQVLLPSLTVYAASIALSLSYNLSSGRIGPAFLASLFTSIACTGLFYLAPRRYTPSSFAVPLNPWLPSLGVVASVFLIGQLPVSTWLVWLYAQLAGLLIFMANGAAVYTKTWRGPGDPLATGALHSVASKAAAVAAAANGAGGAGQAGSVARTAKDVEMEGVAQRHKSSREATL